MGKAVKKKQRCHYESYVIEYFGLENMSDGITEKTKFKNLDFGDLVNLLCGFEQKLNKNKTNG